MSTVQYGLPATRTTHPGNLVNSIAATLDEALYEIVRLQNSHIHHKREVPITLASFGKWWPVDEEELKELEARI